MDVLDGTPRKKSLRMVRNARLPSGKPVPLQPPPASVFAAEPYAPPADFSSSLVKPAEKQAFLARDATGRPVDFITSIPRDLSHKGAATFLSRRAHPPLRQGERKGQLWREPRATSS